MRNPDYSYGWEKLHCAVLCLTGSGNQKERLESAIVSLSNHEIISNPEIHLPREIRDEYFNLIKMTPEKDIRSTINSFSETEVNLAIEKIVSFYDTICRHREPL